MRRFLRYLLRGVADGITECSDGPAVMAAYQRCQPDVVIIDPGRSGGNCITTIKTIVDAYPEARVLLLTDYDDSSMYMAAEQAGACGYLAKDNLLRLPELINASQATKH